jgi:hypothetical protein
MATRVTSRSLPQKTRDLAAAAGEAIGQAALSVTHLAVNQARAAVALADRAVHGGSEASTAATRRRTKKSGKRKQRS